MEQFLSVCSGSPKKAVEVVQLSASFCLPSTPRLAQRVLAEFELTEEQRWGWGGEKSGRAGEVPEICTDDEILLLILKSISMEHQDLHILIYSYIVHVFLFGPELYYWSWRLQQSPEKVPGTPLRRRSIDANPSRVHLFCYLCNKTVHHIN